MFDDDPRKMCLKKGLEQLRDIELCRLIAHLYSGGKVTLNHVNYDEETRSYCPLAIAVGLPDLLRQEPTNQRVTLLLELLGIKIYNTRGVQGHFYTTQRRSDLYFAIVELIRERNSADKEW